MSSMHRVFTVFALCSALGLSAPAIGADGAEWDQARLRNAGISDRAMNQAIERWRVLVDSRSLDFSSYAGFLLTYPGFPRETTLREYAEAALERDRPDPRTVIAFFEKFPPLSNQAQARYALALAALRYPGARDAAIKAWRGGLMNDTAEATILYQYGEILTRADHDARMDALLWERASDAAMRQLAHVSPTKTAIFAERLRLVSGGAPNSSSGDWLRDPGYVYNRIYQARSSGQIWPAISLLSTRPKFDKPVHDPEKWVANLLWAAKGAGADPAVRIAESIDDAFAPGTDISDQSFRLRDDYTSLMWLGGTKALWSLYQPKRAAPLFYRYGAAAKTPGTRSKGFYWAGRALAQAGDHEGANRYFEMAAQYPDHFYGQLSLERLGRAMPSLKGRPAEVPTREQREAFNARPLTKAVREVARDYRWQTSVRFFREISEQAKTEADHVLVADLAQELGRRDLAVILAQDGHESGFDGFFEIGFPLMPTPPGTNWTMVHAITRQESQFAENAISHAGARGLMQLMPGTAREQAGKMGMSYNPSGLIDDALYNVRLGDGYFSRMLTYYGGSIPLAVGAYNAGPGNVNRWLRDNGDPRNGGIDWITWIERIPIYETKNYIQKVLENAVVYETLYPERVYGRGKYPLSNFLGKGDPG